MASNLILIGLGNPIMSDDGIGLIVSREVHRRVPGSDLDASSAGGFDVVDRILGYETAVIIDSMLTGKHSPGNVMRISPGSSAGTLRSGYSHGVGFLEAIKIARLCGAAIPDNVIVYGIEVEDPFSLGEEVSSRVLKKLDAVIERITDDLVD
jgi:hydrogenase maturation protease